MFVSKLNLTPPTPSGPIVPRIYPAVYGLVSRYSIPVSTYLNVASNTPRDTAKRTTLFYNHGTTRCVKQRMAKFPNPALHTFIRRSGIFLQLGTTKEQSGFTSKCLTGAVSRVETQHFHSIAAATTLAMPRAVSLHRSVVRGHTLLRSVAHTSLIPGNCANPLIAPRRTTSRLIRLTIRCSCALFRCFLASRTKRSKSLSATGRALGAISGFLDIIFPFTRRVKVTITLDSSRKGVRSVSMGKRACGGIPLVTINSKTSDLLSGYGSLASMAPAVLGDVKM